MKSLTTTEPTKTSLERDLETVRQTVLDGLKEHPAEVYLFGSRATGGARRTSDIDVAVWPLTALPVGTLAAIREALFESMVPYTVDLIDLRDADDAFRARVLAEGVVWLEPGSV